MSSDDVCKQLQLDKTFFQRHVELQRAQNILKNPNLAKKADVDLYLVEKCLPAASLAMEALSRYLASLQINHGHPDCEQMQKRFNPLNFLAQHLSRSNPSFNTKLSPRRKKMFELFGALVDQERGKRELIRIKATFRKCFEGFQQYGKVKTTDITSVVSALDEELFLDGDLAERLNNFLEKDSGTSSQDDVDRSSANTPSDSAARNTKFLAQESVDFDSFWEWFCTTIFRGCSVPYNKLQAGQLRKQHESMLYQKREEERARREDDIERKRAERDALMDQHRQFCEEIKADEWLALVLNSEEYFISGDPGFGEPQDGNHVTLVVKLMFAYGVVPFQFVDEQMTKWNDTTAGFWRFVQKSMGTELCDGCVDHQTLKALVNVEPTEFIQLRHKLVIEIAKLKAEEIEQDLLEDIDEEPGKPTKKVLSQKHGITMARVGWLYERFTDLLPDGVFCYYPDEPAGLTRESMKQLMTKLKPKITDEEFEKDFDRIDTDGGGEIEFDEFVDWLCGDEIKIAGADDVGKQKPTFEELAVRFDKDMAYIGHLHTVFKDFLGQQQGSDGPGIDDYPIDGGDGEAASLEKDYVWKLLKGVNPGLKEADFDKQFKLIDMDGSGSLEFDEFMELAD